MAQRHTQEDLQPATPLSQTAVIVLMRYETTYVKETGLARLIVPTNAHTDVNAIYGTYIFTFDFTGGTDRSGQQHYNRYNIRRYIGVYSFIMTLM